MWNDNGVFKNLKISRIKSKFWGKKSVAIFWKVLILKTLILKIQPLEFSDMWSDLQYYDFILYYSFS